MLLFLLISWMLFKIRTSSLPVLAWGQDDPTAAHHQALGPR
jgi:hypothetical protein